MKTDRLKHKTSSKQNSNFKRDAVRNRYGLKRRSPAEAWARRRLRIAAHRKEGVLRYGDFRLLLQSELARRKLVSPTLS